MNARMLTLALLAGSLLLGARPVAAAPDWDPDTVRLFERLPVQDEGRVKPLATHARFTLLRLSGRTSLSVDGDTLSATEWLLDSLFRPEVSAGHRVFPVESPDALGALGLPGDRGRDRFSYSDLAPARAALFELEAQYARRPAAERSAVEGQLVRLAQNLRAYEALAHTFGASGNGGLALIPPADPAERTWLTPAEAAAQGLLPPSLSRMGAAGNDAGAFRAAASEFAAHVEGLAKARGEYEHIGLEVFYYRLRVLGIPVFYTLARLLYIAAFVAAALFWLRPRSRAALWVVPGLLAVPTAILVAGIGLRCLIRQRPPVTTLYETILFVTATAVVVALAAEWLTRRRIGLSLAPILGALGLFLADKHEALEGVDTMPSLVAVLDTTFWLSTHVTTISIGYAATLLAAAIAHVFVFAKLLGLKRRDPGFHGAVTRTVYGVLCFGLLFSIVGTVLGGIWASESWGRFWGWDPKENGALMIVLWGLLIVHARLGGYIGDYGINLAALVGGMVVAFSWFGVNLLGVGLHSYGFTSGAFTGLVVFYGLETVVLLAGFAAWMWEELVPPPAGAPEPQGPSAPASAWPSGG